MRVLSSHGGDLVSWTADGDVSIMVSPYEEWTLQTYSVEWFVQDPWRIFPKPYEKFLKALAGANIPESVIKNKMALNQYRKLKHDNEEFFNREVSSTARQDNDIKSI